MKGNEDENDILMDEEMSMMMMMMIMMMMKSAMGADGVPSRDTKGSR